MGDFGEDSDDSDGEGGQGNVSRQIMRPLGHSGKAKKGHICFDASFETGNLGRVDLVNEFEYDLFIRPDTCSPRYRFWFNFTVDNIKQDQRVLFNIVNISKGKNIFLEKMTPIVKSTSRPKWQRIPKQYVFYYKSPAYRNHYILSFCFGFDKEEDVYQFALAPPYSYSKLQSFLTGLEKKARHLNESFNRELLTKSVQNRRLDAISVGTTDKNFKGKRRVVAILARLHPGESPTSYLCQGLLELLISSHAVAAVLRQYVTFKVIPMMNPDGVFLGNYKTTVMGADLNRSWNISNRWCHPTIRAVTDMLLQLDKNKELELDFVLDFHAHFGLKGCFIYGNTYADVYRYERHILFPKLLASMADDYLFHNTMFNSDATKLGSARRYLSSCLSEKVNCYTFEVSIFAYQMKDSKMLIPYTEDSYMRCGRNLLRTFLEYYQNIGAIPLQIITEISPRRKHRRPKSYHHKRPSTVRPYQPKPLTTRIPASIHFNNLITQNASELSFDNCSYRFEKGVELDPITTTNCMQLSYQPKPTFVVLPEPKLSIIDFTGISREALDKTSLRRNHC